MAFASAMVEQSAQTTGKNRRILSPRLGPQEEGKKGLESRVESREPEGEGRRIVQSLESRVENQRRKADLGLLIARNPKLATC